MNKKLFLMGMLGIALAFTTAIIGCDNGSTDDENTDPKKITITGLDGESGFIMVGLMSDIATQKVVAGGYEAEISGNSATVSLKQTDDDGNADENSPDWTGAGSYYLMCFINDTGYIYTNGKSFGDLGITIEDDLAGKLPKISISETTTTVAFNKFVAMPDDE
jgi:hypothetical protein